MIGRKKGKRKKRRTPLFAWNNIHSISTLPQDFSPFSPSTSTSSVPFSVAVASFLSAASVLISTAIRAAGSETDELEGLPHNGSVKRGCTAIARFAGATQVVQRVRMRRQYAVQSVAFVMVLANVILYWKKS